MTMATASVIYLYFLSYADVCSTLNPPSPLSAFVCIEDNSVPSVRKFFRPIDDPLDELKCVAGIFQIWELLLPDSLVGGAAHSSWHVNPLQNFVLHRALCRGGLEVTVIFTPYLHLATSEICVGLESGLRGILTNRTVSVLQYRVPL